jgi:hypothetical protein
VKNFFGLVAVFLLSTLAFAGDPPALPITRSVPVPPIKPRYWTRENALLIAADAAAKSSDMFFTMRNAGRYDFIEHDPLARPFVTHGRAVAGLSQGALFSSDVFMSYQLHKHGHPRLAKAVFIFGSSLNTTGAVISALGGHQIHK